MPIDAMFSGPMLDPFRNMLKDVQAKGLKGKDVDEMEKTLGTMEQLAHEMDDITSYSTKLATDNLYLTFSNAYSRALTNAAAVNQPTDDAGLLKQTLDQYESSYKQIKNQESAQHLLEPIEKLLDLGRSGVSYPVFLRLAEEGGIFEEMKTGDPEPTLQFDLHVAQVMGNPIQEELCNKKLAAFNDLVAKHPFGLADPLALELICTRLDHEYAPSLAKRKAIIEHWDRLHEILFDWIDAHCAFASRDGRWVDARGPRFTQENIDRTKECNPGRLEARLTIFKENFGLSWDDIWTHETYLAEQKACRIFNCDERQGFLKLTFPLCKLGGKPSTEVIKANEALFANNATRNPLHKERFGDAKNPGPGYGFDSFADFVKKRKLSKSASK